MGAGLAPPLRVRQAWAVPFLIQLAVSAVAVAALVALAAWAKIARDAPPLDEAHARSLLADDFPDHALEAVWTAPDGSRAAARAGGELLSVRRIGDGYVTSTERFRPEAWPPGAGA